MEISKLTLFGMPVMTLLAVWGVCYLINNAWKDWAEQRALNKELDEADRAFKAKYRWELDIRTGTDQGKWVRKDGLPDYD
jgi:hypothetical protein